MVNWNAEADAKLLAIIIKVHDIKVDYAKVAEVFGDGVTPKAITHRVANIKNRVKNMGEGSTSAPATPTPKKTTSKAGKKRPRADVTEDEEDYSPSAKKKRTPRAKGLKKVYKEESEEPEEPEESEHVKSENDEDAGGEEDDADVKPEPEEGENGVTAEEMVVEEA